MRISDWSSDVCSSDLLDQIGSAAGQLRLELVDLVITLAPFGLARETLDALDQHPAVPAPIEDGDFAVARQPLPEAPEEMARLFLVARGADRPHLEIARVELRGQPLDDATPVRNSGVAGKTGAITFTM